MCGRFTFTTKKEKLRQLLPGIVMDEWHAPRYNVAPSQPVPAVLNSDAKQLVWIRWGLIPAWAKDETIGNKLINARAETIAEKPSFKKAFQSRRCVVLADGFYEWQVLPGEKRKQPIYFHLKSGEPFAFAGLWDKWNGDADKTIVSCTLITTTPNELVKTVHDRMPVILPTDKIDTWLAADAVDPAKLQQLLLPYPADQMACYAVTSKVNNPKVDDPACLDKLTPLL